MTLDVSREAQARVGRVHALLAADAPAKTGEALFAHLEDAFSRGVADAIRRLPADAGQEQIFESAVASVNMAVSRVLGEHGLQLEPEYVTAALLSVKDHEIVAATWGRPYILLFHPLPGDSGRCKIFDLVDDSGTEQQHYRAAPVRRCFGSVISGRIGKRDRMLLSTEDLASVPGMEPLEQIIMTEDPEAATELVQQRLAPIKEDFPLAMMVLDVTQVRYVEQLAEARPTAEERPGSTHASLAKLRKTESRTSEIMSPSPLSHLAKRGFIAFGGLAENLKKMASGAAAATQEKLKEMHESRKEALEEKLHVMPAATDAVPSEITMAEIVETVAAVAAEPEPMAAVAEPLAVATETLVTPEEALQAETNEALLDILPPEIRGATAEAPTEVVDEAVEAPVDIAAFVEDVGKLAPAHPVSHESETDEMPPLFILSAATAAEELRNKEEVVEAAAEAATPATDEREISIVPVTYKERFNLRKKADAFMNGFVGGFNALAPKSRALLFTALALTMAFNDSVLVGSWQRKFEELGAAEEKRVAIIEQKIDAAEASMIYRDENRAKTLLAEATAAIETLPEKKPRDAEKKAELKSRVAASQDALRHVITLAAPEVVATVAVEGRQVALAKLAMRGDAAWTMSADGDIFKVNLKDGATTKVADLSQPKALIAAGDGILAVGDGGTGRFVSPAGKASDRPVQADADARINDAEIYGSRLYVLDAAHNRIVRHAAEGSGYGKAQSYMKDGTDLSNAVSLAIDSVVYVLKADGSVVRIAKGSHEDFAVAEADPPVTAALRLRTNANAKFLYVLDGSPARILKYNKDTGFLVAQYSSSSLDGATDFTVDEKAKTATVAVGDKLLKFGLPE